MFLIMDSEVKKKKRRERERERWRDLKFVG